jgi:hypothetical protein
MEPFFESVARAFTGNREALPQVEAGILALLALVLLFQLAGVVRRVRAGRSHFRQLAAARGLSDEDTRWAAALARRSGTDPAQLLTHLDLFERATAQALEASAAVAPTGDSEAERIRRLRHAVGFDRLPAHAPLLSTRELAPGTAVVAADLSGVVSQVDEATFTVEVRERPVLTVGQRVSLTLIHAREARYALGCPLRVLQPGAEGGWHLILGHDESPARLQLREYARARADGIIVLRPATGWQGHPELGREVVARLVDVSGGGVQLACRSRLPVGLLVLAEFQLAGSAFAGLRAVVLSIASQADGTFRAHLELTGRHGTEHERLAAAVTRLELGTQARNHLGSAGPK